MAQHQRPWEHDRTGPAEAFLKYVGVASIALAALLTLGLVAGLLVLFVPPTEAIGTVVFTGWLVAVAYAVRMYADSKRQ